MAPDSFRLLIINNRNISSLGIPFFLMLNSAVHRPKCEVVCVCELGGGGEHRLTVDSGTQAVIRPTLVY